MKNIGFISVLVVISLLGTTRVMAGDAIFSDRLGARMMTDRIFEIGFCDVTESPYMVVGPFQVTESGIYLLRDASRTWQGDFIMGVYSGGFNPDDITANRVDSDDDYLDVSLTSGTDYYLVVQPYCEFGERFSWAAYIRGPGDITGDATVGLQEHWTGSWDDKGDLVDLAPDFFGCAPTYFSTTGPHRVEETGEYFFWSVIDPADPSVFTYIYDAPFDLENPTANQVAEVLDGGQATLEAGKDYYYVHQPGCELEVGQFVIMRTPELGFEFNPSVAGLWVDYNTLGQGVMLDEFYESQQVFLAWFTWDTTQRSGNDNSVIGNDGNRWMVALGNYELGQSTMQLDVFYADGGVFNMPDPVSQPTVGSITINMTDGCRGGSFDYDLPGNVTGTAAMQRLVEENIQFCENATLNRPGVITD